MSDMHEIIYGDPKRVRELRIQAEGIIGARKIRATIEEPMQKLVQWLVIKLDRNL